MKKHAARLPYRQNNLPPAALRNAASCLDALLRKSAGGILLPVWFAYACGENNCKQKHLVSFISDSPCGLR